MRMLLSRTARTSAFTIAAVSMALLAGCASKNPLIDGPTSATGANAANASSGIPTGDRAGDGVQTIKNPRFFGILSPYRYNIQQGNFVSKEMISQVKEGMTTEQVSFALGTPLLTDMFHANRWDYVFRLQKGNGEITSSRVSVFFKDNLVVRVDGGGLPTEADYLARISGGNKEAKKATQDSGIAKDAPAPPPTAPTK
ncbi:outer membrane protein assembly factor BamE [Glaciimonas sp. Gout2]|uniref:outer membrane protein assembly factor BamE n=1 Tax=unclassified Glaciimonas TaxID=2644401 RepID=UPI002B233EA4|nr:MULTISPECIES: outer membrane protein assembly factor BamE [unclassified Glaciimonas]MEB0012717.1 outer membrane protein assembly factor BamE [Glaciimonas sp. Cout2]MEB0082196.1 outer membrane protein assembly factor BamE [Glaciimonas sp. Gout2]